MKFQLEIDCDNADFTGPDDDDAESVSAYRALALNVIMGKVGGLLYLGHTEGTCMDANGNTVGQWSLKEDA